MTASRLPGMAKTALFYAAFLVVAGAIGALAGRNAFETGGPLALSLSLGVGTAAVTVGLGLLAYRASPLVQRLAGEIAPSVVGGARVRDLVVLAALSGVGEEALFRGALQPLIGYVWASLLFGAVHFFPDRRYLPWTAWAVGAGFLFGALYAWTGGVLAPALAHALYNVAVYLLLRRRLRTPGRESSG